MGTDAFLQPSRAGSLALVGGALAWDYANTSSARGTPAHQEHLRDAGTLMQWVEHARIMLPADFAFVRAALATQPQHSRRLFERAIKTRELIWAIGNALAEHRPLPEKLLASLLAAHAETLKQAGIKMRHGAYIFVWDPRRDIPAAILGPIVLSALTLLMEKDLLRTKRCAGQECGWLFFDATKNGSRRWCDMRVCGNRAKVRASRLKTNASAIANSDPNPVDQSLKKPSDADRI